MHMEGRQGSWAVTEPREVPRSGGLAYLRLPSLTSMLCHWCITLYRGHAGYTVTCTLGPLKSGKEEEWEAGHVVEGAAEG